MYKQLTKANEKLQNKRIQSQLWTKGDILAFAKMLNSTKFSEPERRKQVMDLWTKLEDRAYDKAYNITLEQSQFGIDWLKKICFTVKGKNRDSKMVADFSRGDFDIVRNFSSFQFVGFDESCNGYNYCHYSPIYRTIDKNGNYFDYVCRMWDAPRIVNRGKLVTKLEKALA